jgi:hypothetical protein
MEAGRSEDPEKYVCPDGSYQKTTGKALTQEVIACGLQMTLSFSAIDREGKKWVEKLNKQREPDFEKWNREITEKATDFSDTYKSVCHITSWTTTENKEEKSCAKTTDFFPEALCEKYAEQKSLAWKNM